MSQSPTHILEQRARAAESSGGISSGAIYSQIDRVIIAKGLGGTVLDYGAGVGQLTRRLLGLQRFERVSAADIMAVPSDLSGMVEWIEQDLNAPISGHDEAFDVVVAAEVIEHLENPRLMMREVFRLLRPGGTAIVTTPNNESWRSLLALLVRGHYVAFSDSCYPAHITPLVRKDLVRIFQEVGFGAPQFCFSDEGGIPGKPVIQWQQVSFGLLRGLRFSDNVIAVVQKRS
jgi:2-polyprenyl-3-methyl-5-hydroxy-6-metoxy-1,4-benzoquinol methylase